MILQTTAALVAITAANSSKGETALSTLLAFLIVIFGSCIAYWIVRYFMSFFKKSEYLSTKDYVFDEGDGSIVLVTFLLMLFICVFMSLVYLVEMWIITIA